MIYPRLSLPTATVALLLGVLAAGAKSNFCQAENLPADTAIPVQFTHTIEAGKAKPNDVVTAKTMQAVILPDGRVLPKGTTLIGHVVASSSFTFDSTPYATQQPSRLSIHFDKIMEKNESIPTNLSLRALSNAMESDNAKVPQRTDETDSLGTMNQIGGDTFSPIGKEVISSDGDIVGYNRKQGVFARLFPGDYSDRYASFHCAGTNTEQSVAIFSASACGLYGFVADYIPDNGSRNNGTFELDSRRHTIKIYARSAALLQVTGS